MNNIEKVKEVLGIHDNEMEVIRGIELPNGLWYAELDTGDYYCVLGYEDIVGTEEDVLEFILDNQNDWC